MALLKTRNYSYMKNDIALNFTFNEGPELMRQLSDFLDLLKEARAEIEKEVQSSPGPRIKMIRANPKGD